MSIFPVQMFNAFFSSSGQSFDHLPGQYPLIATKKRLTCAQEISKYFLGKRLQNVAITVSSYLKHPIAFIMLCLKENQLR